jgi:methyl-accepting chemotaxis protein
MLLFNQLTAMWSRALDRRPANERIRLFVQLACVSLAVLLIAGVGGGAMAAERMAQVEREDVPSLRASRELRELLASTSDAAAGTDLSGALSRLGRADSLAERFHALATSARVHERHGPAMRAVDERFATWYQQARRAAQRLPSGDETFTSSAELALVGERAVRMMLNTDITGTERDIIAELAGARRVQLATWMLMAVLTVITGMLLVLTGSAITDSNGRSMRRATTAARALADGETQLDLPASDDSDLRGLHQALAKIGAVTLEHSITAEALADGRHRRVTGPARLDRIGAALARIADYEEELAHAARSIADGDLSVTVEPRSSQDLLGRAHEEMTGALVRLLGEIEDASVVIAGSAEQMHDAAERVASGATDGAESARRTADSLARMTADAQGAAARAQGVEHRAAENAATMQEGSAVLHESLDALSAVLREASVVESIASDAGLLAVNAAIEAARAGNDGNGFAVVADEVRVLAQHASDAAREISHISSGGAARAMRSAELLDRLAPSIDDSAAMVRELSATARRQADEMVALSAALASANKTTRRAATGATQLRLSADSLAVHAQRLGALLRGLKGEKQERTLALA